MQVSRILVTLSILTGLVIFFIHCGEMNAAADVRGSQYAGQNSCINCHKAIAENHSQSNHFKTSGLIDTAKLTTYLASTHNRFRYDDSSIVLTLKDSGFFAQHYISNGKVLRSARPALAIGSGEKAQTYGYWKDKQLLQAPLTWLAQHGWTNSPGYPVRQPYFDRVIESRCLECHASYAEKKIVEKASLQLTEQLDPASIVYGIDCERCHGPAAEHVRFHEKNPSEKQGKYLTSIKTLSRQQQLDVCAACHSGNDLDVQKSLFAFKPGDTLDNFFLPHFGSGKTNVDVHGKQFQLLRASKCFQQSKMTCNTCHVPHRSVEDNQAVMSAKCMTCHQQSAHATQLQQSATGCIDCHMPLQESKALDFTNGAASNKIAYMLRTHKIAVYKPLR